MVDLQEVLTNMMIEDEDKCNKPLDESTWFLSTTRDLDISIAFVVNLAFLVLWEW
jgi:hypothetical protein